MRERDLAAKVFERLRATAGAARCDDHFAIDAWEWPQGVALYSLYRRYLAGGDDADLAFLASWYDRALSRPLPPLNVNTTAPLLALACLVELEGPARARPEWLRLCSDWAERVMRDMPRTEEGGIQHVTSHLVNPGELWADTLFMTALFLAKAGVVLGRPDYVEEAIYQFLLHIRCLADPETGLWFHGWSFEGRHHFGGIHWARGNAWFTMAAVELLEMLTSFGEAAPQAAASSFGAAPASGASPSSGAAARAISGALASQVRALSRVQAEDGLWRTILDDPDSYTETSASAGIAYACLKGARLGFLDASCLPAARAATRGVIARIGEDGLVGGVSHGTAVGWDAGHYRSIPVAPTAYGQGLAFLMLTEFEGG